MDCHDNTISGLQQHRLIPYTPRDSNAYQQLSDLPCITLNEAKKDQTEYICAHCGDRSPNQPLYGDIRVPPDALYVFYTIPCGHLRCTYCALEWLDTLGIFYNICRACDSEKGPGGVIPNLSFILDQINVQLSAGTPNSNGNMFSSKDINDCGLQPPSPVRKPTAHPHIDSIQEETCDSLAYPHLDHDIGCNDRTVLEHVSEIDKSMEVSGTSRITAPLSSMQTRRKRTKPSSSAEASPSKAAPAKKARLAPPANCRKKGYRRQGC